MLLITLDPSETTHCDDDDVVVVDDDDDDDNDDDYYLHYVSTLAQRIWVLFTIVLHKQGHNAVDKP